MRSDRLRPKKLLSQRTVARLLGVHIRTVQMWTREGRWPEVVWLTDRKPMIPAAAVRLYQDMRTERLVTVHNHPRRKAA